MQKAKFICDDCGLICKYKSDLEDHVYKEHNRYSNNNKSNYECIYWKQGFCKKANNCSFKHGRIQRERNQVSYCKFKDNCKFYTTNTCRYEHPPDCWNYENCTYKNCKFQHKISQRDFQNFHHQQKRN